MIRCEKLTKRYGKTEALTSLDLSIDRGRLHGFVGPNGAGKTTAMRILSTLLEPTAGDAFVDGVSVVRETKKARRMVGYMPDFFGVYDNLKAWEYLDLYAGCLRMGEKERRHRIDELLELTVLSDKREAFVDELSRGMKQRLCLARAMLHDPALLILDEPASGMDPRARTQMRDILREIGKSGKTVLISSHILPELSELCDSMSILEKGRLVFSGSVHELEQKMETGMEITIRLSANMTDETIESARLCIQNHHAQLQEEGKDVWRIRSAEDDAKDRNLLASLIAVGMPVCEFKREHVSLETVFMEVTRG